MSAALQSVRVPDAPGWWARRREGHVEWFRLQAVQEHEEPVRLVIWIRAIQNFAPIEAFCGPLTRWCGPVELPWTPDDLD